MEIAKKKIQKQLKKIRVFILDMDGTIYLGNELFSYTHDFLAKVIKSNREFYFFTNNSSKDVSTYLYKLSNFGIEIEERQMMISTHVILQYLKEHHDGNSVYVIGTPALRKAFAKDGWVWNEVNPDIVILGFDTTLTYEKLETACHFIRKGALYYGINPDLNCPMEHHTFIPDCGSIAKLIEASTGRYPEFFGKPNKKTLDYIIKETGYQPEEIAIVGDRLYTDIALADGSDVTSILVMSGETKFDDIEISAIKPDIMIEHIGVLADVL